MPSATDVGLLSQHKHIWKQSQSSGCEFRVGLQSHCPGRDSLILVFSALHLEKGLLSLPLSAQHLITWVFPADARKALLGRAGLLPQHGSGAGRG